MSEGQTCFLCAPSSWRYSVPPVNSTAGTSSSRRSPTFNPMVGNSSPRQSHQPTPQLGPPLHDGPPPSTPWLGLPLHGSPTAGTSSSRRFPAFYPTRGAKGIPTPGEITAPGETASPTQSLYKYRGRSESRGSSLDLRTREGFDQQLGLVSIPYIYICIVCNVLCKDI